MSREQRLADQIFALPPEELEKIRGHPQKVLDLIESYSDQHPLKITGPTRADLVVKQLQSHFAHKPPKLMLELGGYIGYSAILFSHYLSPDYSAQYYCIEINEEYAAIAHKLVELAGLENRIEVIHGKASKALQTMQKYVAQLPYMAPDFIYLDHGKELFIPDLRVLESLGMVAPGTVVVAANSYAGGEPEYVRYVRGSPAERREYNYDVRNISGKILTGRWNVLYQSANVNVRSNEGIEITRCVDYLSG